MTELALLARWSDAKPHLEALKDTVSADLRPLLQFPGSAPFAVCREFFSYVDYLGALYTGTMGVRERLTGVLRTLFSSIDASYGARAAELYQMYRCGTVHQFRPKTLLNAHGQTLYWLNYRGARSDQVINFRGTIDTVTHLLFLQDTESQQAWLPVSSDCLVEDLEAAIDAFTADADLAARVKSWNAVAPHFIQPFAHEFTF